MEKIRKGLLVLIIVAGVFPVFAQTTGANDKIKSIIVLDEKYNTLVRKQYKESETYFDSRGNIIEDITYKQGEISKHFKYQYNSDNQKIREEEFEPSGALTEASEYTYKDGLRIEKIVYDANNKIKSKKVYQYTTF